MNKFEIPFNIKHEDRMPDEWIEERLAIEQVMTSWCLENIGPGEFPHWQLGGGAMYFPSSLRFKDIDWAIIHSTIFIFKDEDKVAFKLRFQL